MKTLYIICLLSILSFAVACGEEKKNLDAVIREKLSSDLLEERVDGLYIARRVKDKKTDEILVEFLDRTADGGVIRKEGASGSSVHLPLKYGALVLLKRKFPESNIDEPGIMPTDREIVSFKKWWALNKDKIRYNEDGSHGYVSPPEVLSDEEQLKVSLQLSRT